ncbi:bifunctional diguanylate cyclase/phosphodiesterase [Roseateles sp. DAIF2]|uniref:putative bifunctional diguanylate cyclase/phosphodiesterase n=1 Tax=Roseateles sp. DAIF2 TaxID=2714952 RepID=UPI00201E5F2D|nr:EAL domain-containing protein [Roseateles sp. DAIF2]
MRTAIAVPFVLLFAATVLLQALTQQRHVDQLIQQESARQLDSLAANTRNRLALFLDEPFRIQLGLADAIARHRLYRSGDMSGVWPYLRGVYGELYQDDRQISVLSFGSSDGQYAGLRRETGGFTLMLKDMSTEGRLRIYQGDHPSAISAEFPDYDPRGRPWYAPVLQTGRPGWSAIYTNRDERAEVAISAIAPVRRDGELLGVVAADVKLDGLNRFLRDEPLRGRGLVFITELDGRLVAHSEPGGVMGQGERLLMRDSPVPLLRAAAPQVDGAPTESGSGFTLRHEGELYFGRITPYSDTRGLDWRIVVLVPEAALLGEIRSAQGRSMLLIAGIAGLAIALGLWGIGRITRPILETAAAANRLARGRWQEGQPGIPQGAALRETALLVRAFNEMAQRLQQSFGRMREQLVYDDMTRLLTRRGLLEQADWPVPRPAALLLVGLDAFRAINNSLGHGTGDQLLQVIAARLRERLPAQLRLARVSGDEFALLHLGLTALPEPAALQALGTEVLALFEAPFTSGEDEVLVTASIGLVGGLLPAEALGDWLRHASVALGEAKRRGRGQAVLFEPAMMEHSTRRARLAIELRQALEREELSVHYQPMVRLDDGRVRGLEALVRWHSPERGAVPPGVFIPIAEESDLILALGDWVLRRAMDDVAARLDRLTPDFELHVNVSVRQLIQSDFAATLQAALLDSGLPARRLTLEITESLLLVQDGVTEERLRQVRELGVKIAIDDFGTGYSSLAYLQRLPFDCLKIDQSFVRNLSKSEQDAAIVTAVLRMAEGLGVSAIAEGVETEAEASRLRELGCLLAQGYHYGRPQEIGAWDQAGLG